MLNNAKSWFGSIFLVLVCLGIPVQAQKELQYTQNKSDQTLRSDIRIDPATHALGIQVPLASYPGRAGANVPVTLYYSSKLWRLEFDDIYDNPNGGAPRAQTFAKYAEQSVAGWTASVDIPTIEFTFFLQSYDLTSTNYGQDGGPTGYRGFIARIHVHMPDGSTHELRKDDAPHNWGTESNYGFTGSYYAVDGARMRFDFDPGAHSGVLFLPDGGRYTFADPQGGLTIKATQYTDRNGNTLTYNSTTRQWTDTLGRTLSSPLPASPILGGLPPAPGDVQYTVPGFGTSSLTYTLKWRRLNDSTTGETVLSNPDPDPNNRLYYPGSHNCQTWPALALSPRMFSGAGTTLICASQKFNPVVLAEIVFPNNTSYRFRYNPYGEIDTIYLPGGGYERYQHAQIAPMTYLKPPYDQVNRGVSDRWVSSDGTASTERHSQYGIEYAITTAGPYVVTCTEPDGTVRKSYLHAHPNNYAVPGELNSPYKSVPFGMDDARTGYAYEERLYASAGGTLLRRKLTDWAVTPSTVTTGPPGPYGNRNPRIAREVEILIEPATGEALAKSTTHDYETSNQFSTGATESALTEFDYVATDQTTASSAAIDSFSNGTTLRRTETSFLETTNQSYRDRNLLGLVSSVVIRDMTRNLPGGVVIAQSSNSYDELSLLTCGATNWTDPSSFIRGNVTSMTRWLNYNGSALLAFPGGSYVTTHQQYDQCGSLRVTTDANGNQSQISYSSAFNYVYPTTVTTAVPDTTGSHSLSQSLITTSNYDSNTGLVTATTDANGQVTSMVYNDPLNRLTQVTKPDGGHTTYSYSDTAGDLYVRVLADQDASRSIETRQYFDGLNRPIRKFIYQGQASTPWTVIDTYYDNMGRVAQVSNAYDTATASGVVPATCSLCTLSAYDVLGRVVKVTTPDGAHIDTAYSGLRMLVTDQTGKQRISQIDAMGRLRDIWEVTAADQWTESVSFPNHAEIVAAYRTHYNYDLFDNLIEVVQSSQPHRFFLYDSLKRLLRSRNPELGTYGSDVTDPITGNNTWSGKYVYDNTGNLTQKTDPRGIVSTYSYDALNRNTIVSYSDGTARIDRYYDNAPNGKGVLWYETTSNPGTNALIDRREFTSYDVMGRPLSLRQVLASNSVNYEYITQRSYNRAGMVTLQTYPSNRSVTYNYDVAGRLADKDASNLAFTGNLGGDPRTYSRGITYTSSGQLSQEQFGTVTPVFSKRNYNSRQQLIEVLASTNGGDSSWNRGKIVNDYGTTNNNGNLRSQSSYIPANDQNTSSTSWSQNYSYDPLNRLTNVTELNSANQFLWQQSYSYDRFGNRRIDMANTTQLPGVNNRLDTAVSTSTNRLYAPGETDQNHPSINYDNAGNQIKDYYSVTGSSFDRTYDAESRLKDSTLTSGGGSVVATYTYDAAGQRVRRKVGTTETWQIYGFDGELVAEYPATGAANNPTKEYGYRNGQLLISADSGNASASPVFGDDFNDNSLNPNSWTVWYPGSTPTVTEQSQQLQIALSPSTAAYNGVYSNSTYSLTNRMVQVESVQSVSQAGWCENFLELELDANNYFMIQVGAGNMIFRSRVNGVNDQTLIAFDGVANRFWRVRHDQSANLIYFETSADGTVWLTRKTVTPGFSLTSLRFHLLAGAYGTGNSSPGTAKYDNFKLLPSSAGPVSLTVPNAGFEAPVVGNGNFQYGPTGGSWTFAGGGGISGTNSPFTGVPSAAPEGVQVAFIQAGGTISQSIAGFQANASYIITFKAIQRTNCCNSTGQDIAVYIDNTLVGTFHPSNIAYVEYSTPTFTTTSGAHTVKFAGLNVNGDQTAFLDNVRITGSPRPGYGVQWLVADQLGTPRMTIDESGGLANIKRHDYLPFGEELPAATGLRTTAQGYSTGDGVRQQFTAKERDVETSLDYFGARYFASYQGRFTSIDPIFSSGKPVQPQSWNRYSYCINQPLKYTDPKGLIWGTMDFEVNGHKYRRYRWFNGDKVGKGYTPFIPAKDGTVIALRDGGGARIFRDGTRMYFGGPGQIQITGQDNLNLAAGTLHGVGKALAGLNPGAHWLVDSVMNQVGGVDRDSSTYENGKSIGNGVVAGLTLFVPGPAEAEAAEEGLVLFHGSDAESVESIIANGLNRAAAAEKGGGDIFWASSNLEEAGWFAQTNPAGGTPSVLRIDISVPAVQKLVKEGALQVEGSTYKFAGGAWEQLKNLATFSKVPQ